MFKLVKYDLKSYYKDFIIMISAIVLLNLALGIKINRWENDQIFMLSMFISFAAAIIVVICNINLFSRDMYSESGYLLFTIPKSGYYILVNKLITAIVQCFAVFIVSSVIMILWSEILKVTSGFVFDIRNMLNVAVKNLSLKFIIFGILSILVIYLMFLLTVYLSITLSKVAIGNKKFGKLGSFVIFIILIVAQIKIEDFVAQVFPQTITINMISSKSNLVIGNTAMFDVNISLIILSLVILAVMFYVVGYLLQNKLDI